MTGSAPNSPKRRWWGGVVLVAVLAAACGSSQPAIDQAAARVEIIHHYQTLFNLSDPSVEPKLAVVENGGGLRAAVTEALGTSLAASAAGATVHRVTFLSSSACTDASEPSPCAKVVYDIVGTNGTALQAGAAGYAVLVGGKWLVAKNTVCGLFQLLYTTEGRTGTPPGC